MVTPLLPARADNVYHGHKLALVLFGLLLAMRTAIALGSIFNGRTAATSADGIPIDSYTPAGANTVVALFGLLGLSNLIISVIGVVVLIRYRTLVPFMLVVLLVHQASRYIVLQALPIARTGAPPGNTMNLVILGVMIVGLGLALWERRGSYAVAPT